MEIQNALTLKPNFINVVSLSWNFETLQTSPTLVLIDGCKSVLTRDIFLLFRDAQLPNVVDCLLSWSSSQFKKTHPATTYVEYFRKGPSN